MLWAVVFSQFHHIKSQQQVAIPPYHKELIFNNFAQYNETAPQTNLTSNTTWYATQMSTLHSKNNLNN